MSGSFKVAAVQAAPVFMDLQGTVDKTIKLIEEAASSDVRLIVFPETWLPGYPFWAWLGPVAYGMRYVQRYSENSLDYNSDHYRRICQAAAKNDIFVMLGLSELNRGTLYIGQALISNKGETIFKRRKLRPTHVERTIFGDGDGSDFHVVETELGNVGGLCCWEHIQPLSKYVMFNDNEQIHCAAWPAFGLYANVAYSLGHEVNMRASQIYALEGQCFVIASCALVTQEMIDELCTSDEQRALLSTGGGYSKVFGPDGSQISTDLAPDQEGLVYADVDLSMIALARAAADPAGHYSRPDVVQVLLDRSKKIPVIEKALVTTAADEVENDEPAQAAE
jgi:aliphatic nitrilase